MNIYNKDDCFDLNKFVIDKSNLLKEGIIEDEYIKNISKLILEETDESVRYFKSKLISLYCKVAEYIDSDKQIIIDIYFIKENYLELKNLLINNTDLNIFINEDLIEECYFYALSGLNISDYVKNELTLDVLLDYNKIIEIIKKYTKNLKIKNILDNIWR